jgi:hypothetical protein
MNVLNISFARWQRGMDCIVNVALNTRLNKFESTNCTETLHSSLKISLKQSAAAEAIKTGAAYETSDHRRFAYRDLIARRSSRTRNSKP